MSGVALLSVNFSVFLSLQPYPICPSDIDEKMFGDVATFFSVSPSPLPLFMQISSFVHITSRKIWVSIRQNEDTEVYVVVCFSFGFQDHILGELSNFIGGGKRNIWAWVKYLGHKREISVFFFFKVK